MMILLIRHRENGNLHWVAARDRIGNAYRVYDSLVPDPYEEGEKFTERYVLTALAVSPSGQLQTGFLESLGHLTEGAAEIKAFQERLVEVKRLTAEN